MGLAPFPVVIPLVVAAALAGAGGILPRRALDIAAAATAAAVLAICSVLVVQSSTAPIVYWFGGWRPENGVALGVGFTIDPIGAGMAALVALIMLAALVFSWRYFESIKSLYHALMLVFLAAMCGLCLTGDLFNLFVWFELMSAAGVALCGYKAEEYGPLQGALNFAVLNTLGAYLSLTGVGLAYVHTGGLNFAQVHAALVNEPRSAFVAIVFLFLCAGFLVKAAAFPFHFWLADAHAVAPTPVCMLFSGVMVELGVYAVARLYWNVFAETLTVSAGSVHALFLWIGTSTAIVGAICCFGQRHLKRLLAFSTVSHIGLMFVGFALLDADALAGTALYVIGHGAVKASLFVCAGMLLNRFSSVDELDLRGKGRQMPGVGVLMAVGAIALTGLPPFANFFGEGLIEDSARHLGLSWVWLVFMVAGALTAGAVLRVTGRIFLGWGHVQEATSRDARHVPMKKETEEPTRRIPVVMWLPALVLLALAAVLGPVQGLQTHLRAYAVGFMDAGGRTAYVMEGKPLPPVETPAAKPLLHSAWRPGLGMGIALIIALWALFPDAIGRRGAHLAAKLLRAAIYPFHVVHTGRVGDYVAWFVLGFAAYAVFLSLR